MLAASPEDFQDLDDEGLRRDPQKRALWLSPRDAAKLFRRAVEKPDVGYAVVFGTSVTSPELLSRRSARELLDFAADDDVVALYGGRDA